MESRESIVTSKKVRVPLTREQVEENMRLIDDLKFFLATAPANWQEHQIIRRYYLNTEEGFVSCVYWNNLYFITGTDIVRCVVYRFEQFGREIVDRKKFEEGVFSDLRALKCGEDAILESSKSNFLEFLYRNSCLRTQKKQKVFFWFSVEHDKLFTDALERDLKKEQLDQPSTTRAVSEPALSFKYDSSTPLFEQLTSFVQHQKMDTDIGSVDQDVEDTQSTTSPADDIIKEEPLEFTEDDQVGHVYHIKEENGDPIIDMEDDFPLDYFPQTNEADALFIDPNVFVQIPESYNNQFLIDQTNAKTPFDKSTFENEAIGETGEVSFEEEVEHLMQVPPTFQPLYQQQFSPYIGPAGPMVPMYQGTISVSPQIYYSPYHHHHHEEQPQQQQPGMITNGQYYDSLMNGEIPQDMYNDYDGYYAPFDPNETYASGYSITPNSYAFPYGGQGSHDGMSPFSRVFPGFQAMAPPDSPRGVKARNVKFVSSNAKIVKPSRLRHTSRVNKAQSQRLEKESISNREDHQGGCDGDVIEGDGYRDGDEDDEQDNDSDSVNNDLSDSKSDDRSGVENEEAKENNADSGLEEYTTLPTPESTVPEHHTSL